MSSRTNCTSHWLTGRPCLFVGAQRSTRAQQLGVTWGDRALASKTLHDALAACAFPHPIVILNLWNDAGDLQEGTLKRCWRAHQDGYVIIALGKRVAAYLQAHTHIPCVAMIHPAARGAIRQRACYQAHVATTLQEAHIL